MAPCSANGARCGACRSSACRSSARRCSLCRRRVLGAIALLGLQPCVEGGLGNHTSAPASALCAGLSVFVYELPAPTFVARGEEQSYDVVDPELPLEEQGTPYSLGIPCTMIGHAHKGRKDHCEVIQHLGMAERQRLGAFDIYMTDQFALGHVVVRYVLNHCRAERWEDADLFLVPVPIFELKFAIQRKSVKPEQSQQYIKSVEEFLQRQPAWQKYGGRDHVVINPLVNEYFEITTPNDYYYQTAAGMGLRRDNPAWAKTLFVSIEAVSERAFSVPYPTFLHPRSDAEVEAWLEHVRSMKKIRHGVLAAGWRRRRMRLLQLCKKRSNLCWHRSLHGDYKDRLMEYLEADFSIQPGGDTPTRRGFFDSLLCGAIPIIFRPFNNDTSDRNSHVAGSAHYAYENVYAKFFEKGWVERFALVAKDENDAMKLIAETSEETIQRLRDNILEVIPSLLYWDFRWQVAEDSPEWRQYGPQNPVARLLHRLKPALDRLHASDM
eukprot:scaffold1449_cov244-Pinguiococcus_pyrenoidosus.AAC.1